MTYAMCEECKGLTLHASGCSFNRIENMPREMRICEINHLFLRPDVAYIFTVDPNCKACVKYAGAYANEPVSNEPAPVELFEVRTMGFGSDYTRQFPASAFSELMESTEGGICFLEISGTKFKAQVSKEVFQKLSTILTK